MKDFLGELKNPWLAFALVCMIGLIVLLYSIPVARAHDHKSPVNNEWLKSLTSKSKTLCCNGDDADQPDDWEASGDRYRVKVDGVWYDVPEAALVDGPNRSGGALVWVNRGYMGKSIRCFMPGSMT